VRGGQIEVSRGEAASFAFGGEEDSHASDEQGLGEAFNDRVEQGAEIGLGVDAATELDERFAVVEAFLIEDAIHPCLNSALEWIEDDSCDDDGREQSPYAEIGESGVNDLTGESDDAEVNSDERGGSKGIGNSSLEDEVHVHESITDDRPAESEGKDDQRETGQLRYLAIDGPVGEVRNDVEQGEGSDGDEGAAGEPLELLTLQGRLGPTISVAEDYSCDDVVEGEVSESNLIESMKEDLSCRPEANGGVLETDKEDPGEVEQHTPDAAGQPFALV